jgi:hypothetical protein
VEIRNPDKDAERRLLVWSTIVDAPITYGMSEPELRDWIKEEQGAQGLRVLDERMRRVREVGTSSRVDRDWTSVISGNRAGPGETELDARGLWAAYAYAPDQVAEVQA